MCLKKIVRWFKQDDDERDENAEQRWTEEDENYLFRKVDVLALKGKTNVEAFRIVAKDLERSPAAVKQKYYHMKR